MKQQYYEKVLDKISEILSIYHIVDRIYGMDVDILRDTLHDIEEVLDEAKEYNLETTNGKILVVK